MFRGRIEFVADTVFHLFCGVGNFAPAGEEILLLNCAHLADVLLRGLKQAGVLERNGYLTYHALHRSNCLGTEIRFFGGLHIQRAEDMVAREEREGDL